MILKKLIKYSLIIALLTSCSLFSPSPYKDIPLSQVDTPINAVVLFKNFNHSPSKSVEGGLLANAIGSALLTRDIKKYSKINIKKIFIDEFIKLKSSEDQKVSLEVSNDSSSVYSNEHSITFKELKKRYVLLLEVYKFHVTMSGVTPNMNVYAKILDLKTGNKVVWAKHLIENDYRMFGVLGAGTHKERITRVIKKIVEQINKSLK